MSKIYGFNMFGWESSSRELLINNGRDYSDSEYYELVSELYAIVSHEKQLEEKQLLEKLSSTELSTELCDYYKMYQFPDMCYGIVLDRLVSDYGFIKMESDISFTVREDSSFVDNSKDEHFDVNTELKLIRDKYNSYIREKKIKRIINDENE